MKRSALLLTNAILATSYVIGLIGYMASGSGIAQWNGNIIDTIYDTTLGLFLAAHAFLVVIGLVLLWIAYAANSAGCSVASGILFLLSAFQAGHLLPQIMGVLLAALSFFGLFSIRALRRAHKEKIMRIEEREALKREEEIARAAVARYAESIGASAPYMPPATMAANTPEIAPQATEEPPKSPSKWLRKAAYALLFIILATALVYFGPRALIWYENLLNQILEWSKSIA